MRLLPIAGLALSLFAAPMVLAEDWVRMSGPEISEALTDRELTYENARQSFFASGDTVYESNGSPSPGRWRIEGERYCSLWPPQGRWDCYDMYRVAGEGLDIGDRVRFTVSGSNTEGVIAGEVAPL